MIWYTVVFLHPRQYRPITVHIFAVSADDAVQQLKYTVFVPHRILLTDLQNIFIKSVIGNSGTPLLVKRLETWETNDNA